MAKRQKIPVKVGDVIESGIDRDCGTVIAVHGGVILYVEADGGVSVTDEEDCKVISNLPAPEPMYPQLKPGVRIVDQGEGDRGTIIVCHGNVVLYTSDHDGHTGWANVDDLALTR